MGLRTIPVANIVGYSVPHRPLLNGEKPQLCTLQIEKVSCSFPFLLSSSSLPLIDPVQFGNCCDSTALPVNLPLGHLIFVPSSSKYCYIRNGTITLSSVSVQNSSGHTEGL